MTNETLEAHKKAYRSGTISIKDHQDMVEELVTRNDAVEQAKGKIKERWADLLNDALEIFDGQ